MAYMTQENKKELTPAIKAVLKKYGMKGSIAVRNYSTLVVNVKEGRLALQSDKSYDSPNVYGLDRHYSGEMLNFLTELRKAMNNGNHDNSDIQTDYFDVGWYITINLGNWNRPYVCTESAVTQ